MLNVNDQLLTPLVNLLFPLFCYTCGEEGHSWCLTASDPLAWPLCFGCRRSYHPQAAQPNCPQSLPLVWLGRYTDVRLRTAIYDWKYAGYHAISQDWARLLAESVRRQFLTASLLVPIPLHWQRRLARGYNQTEILAQQISAILAWPAAHILERKRATAVQAHLTDDQRAANVAGAFAVRLTSTTIKRTPVWLVDDVMTTGATLQAARQTLTKAGWSVQGVIVIAATGQSGSTKTTLSE